MATIVTRASNGAPLSHTQMDDNFTNLNTDKIESTLAADLDTNDNAIKNTAGVNGHIDVSTRVQLTQNIANNLLQLENQNTQGLGLSIKAGSSTHPGSLAIFSVADKDGDLKLIAKASGEVNVYHSLGVDSLYVANTDATTAQISTLNSGHDLNITTNAGTLSLNGLNYPASDGTTGQFLKTDGAGNLSFATVSTTAIDNVVEDTTPQLGGDLDQNGNMITDASRNYQIIGNEDNITTLSGYFDSINGSASRVHGVVNVNEIIGNPSDRVHTNPTLSFYQQDADATPGPTSPGMIRMNYVEGILDLNSYDNTTSGFGQGHNAHFVSSVVKNSASGTTSNITESTVMVVAPQIDTANPVNITDLTGIQVRGYANDNSGGTITATNFYGFYYNSPAGPDSSRLGTSSHYSFYGEEANAGAYNAGGFQLPSVAVANLTTAVPQTTGNMVFCTDETGGAVPVFFDGTNWRRTTDRAVAS